MALTYEKEESIQLHRVGFTGDDDDPNYPDGNTEFEFVASAALDSLADELVLVEGLPALRHDLNIPLKTILVYLALGGDHLAHRREVVQGLPSGPYLLDATDSMRITPQMMEDVLTRHFARLQKMALTQAARNRVEIGTLALTYPNYLYHREGTKDFDKYMDYFIYLLRKVWGPHVMYRLMSEGQAVALYVCSPFFDTLSGEMRQQIERLFNGLNKSSWINLCIIDSGSSSLVCLVRT